MDNCNAASECTDKTNMQSTYHNIILHIEDNKNIKKTLTHDSNITNKQTNVTLWAYFSLNTDTKPDSSKSMHKSQDSIAHYQNIL